MQITTEQGVPLVTFLLFFIVSRLFPFVTTQSLNWYGKLFLFFVYSTANFEVAQGGFPSRFCLGFFSQHQTSTTLFWSCGRNRTTPPLPCSLVRFSTSTPKPRAEGSSPSAPAKKPAETLRFCRFSFFMCCMVMVFTLVQTVGFRIRLHPSSPVPILSSTQNAPGFAHFRLFRVRFFVFCPFGRAKFLTPILCILPHSVHRLKSLVIPVRREVSFLT